MFKLKQEYIYQLIALAIYYISMLFNIDHQEIEYSGSPFDYLGLALYHGVLFGFVNYVLTPRYFSKKKILVFVFLLLLTITVFTIVEEKVIEQILFSGIRGKDPLSILDLYYFIAEIGLALMVFIVIKLLFDNFENQKKIAAVEKNSLQNELKFLRSQIQPHVLFNSLNNLYEYTLSKSDKAPELVLQLSKVLRYVLYETDKECIPLKKEINFIREYISLQETQLESRGKVHLKIEWNNAKDDLQIAPFVMIPFIENAFKHSLDSKESDIEIFITLKIEGTKLNLFVSNTYEHYSKTETKLTESGIGLKNVKKRLELLYSENNILTIKDLGSVYEINLALNLEE